MPTLPTHNSRQNFLKICFPQQQKGVEKTMICFIEIQSKKYEDHEDYLIMKIKLVTWNIRLFIFCMMFLGVMTLQFCNNIYHIVWC